MKHLKTIADSDVIAGAEPVDYSDFHVREAARAVLLDENGEVILLRVGKDKYHKLPGGGFKQNEDARLALGRELMEEVGRKAEVLQEIGIVTEYRNENTMKQISHCYIAKQIGEPVENSLDPGEIEKEMYEIRASSIAEAIELLRSDKPESYSGQFIQLRDVFILEQAQRLNATL